MAALLDKILASGHSPLPFLLSTQTESFFSASARFTHSVTCPASDVPEFAASAYSQPPGSGTSPTPTHSSSHPVICAQQLWAGPAGSKSHSDSSRPHKGLWRSPDLGPGTHLPSCPPPLRIFILGASTSSPWVAPATLPPWPEGAPGCQLGSARLAWVGGGQGPHPSCPRPSGPLASPGPHTGAGFARRPPWDSCPGGCCQWPAACPPAPGCPSCGSREGT